jgi:hypothetical protein
MQFLDIHFLDVGHGDCTVVEFPERLTVIDINNCKSFGKETEAELRRRNQPPPPSPFFPQLQGGLSALAAGGLGALGGLVPPPAPPTLADIMAQIVEARLKLDREKDKLTDPITYYKAHFAGRPIFRYVQTHPDMDHMAGLHRIWAEEKIPILNFWDTKHCIEKDEVAMLTGEVNHEIKDWQTYKQLRKSAGGNPTVLHLAYGAKGDFWNADGISIWAPFDHAECDNPDADTNGLSYVLRIQLGKSDIILGGDARVETWERLLKMHRLPKIGLLKASHHGRKSGYHMESVKAMNPDLTIVSVGELKGKDDASASYERFSKVGCYSTLDHGDIIARCYVDGEIRLYERNWKQIASSWD